LWINGQYVGFSKNSRNTASFNITPYLAKKGENTVAVEVYRNSDASLLESQDMFRLPGIFRSTYLTSTPQVQIQDLKVLAGMDGNVNVTTTVRNLSKKDVKHYSVSYTVYPVKLYTDDTEDAVCTSTEFGAFTVTKGDAQTVTDNFSVESPKLWSAEEPNRYVLVARLLDAKGKTVETVSTYFGFRTVEIRDTPAEDDEFGLAGRYYYVNDKPVKLKGVNRHENNLATGHHVTREQMEHEAMLMKAGNINHVRNSHYNDDPYWYMMADKYGIYLEDEANLESHEYYYGDASLSHVPEWRDAHVARNLEMVNTHFNHPSIVIWSLGNEAGPGQNFVEAYNAIKTVDTSRPVQYERNNWIVDMGSNQYPSVNGVREMVKGKSNIKYPFHISEYAHSMGNGGGNLKDYW
ncbi:MAG: beta-galactosidase, partial [Muribaculaceae bacterium]|nr:beta-galactosidase [Muribaculaceae bacterium]